MGVRERREKEREQRRHDILTSARAVFLKHGFEQTSMDRIAQAAELAKGTLYLYFKNREELLMALIGDDFEELLEMIEQTVKRKESSDKKLLHCTTAFYRFSQDNQFFYQLMTQLHFKPECLLNQQSTAAITQFQEQNERLMALLSQVLQEGVDTKVFQLEHPIHYVVMQLMVAMKGTMVVLKNNMIPVTLKRPSDEKIIHDVATLLIKGLRCQQAQ